MREMIVELGMMSIRASIVIGVVLILRMAFDKLHIAKKYIGLLWVIPFLCLVLPWRIESDFSAWRVFANVKPILVQDESYVEEQVESKQMTVVAENISSQTDKNQMEYLADAKKNSGDNNKDYESQYDATLQTETDNLQKSMYVDRYQIMFSIWIVGSLFLLAYGIGAYSRLQRKVLCSETLEGNIYLADDISTPFVLGVVKPKIYVPSNMKQENMRYVIEHERTHIMRKDYLWKLFACLAVGIHWFNPIAWVAFRLWEKDIEMACDEETINRIGADNRWDYANVLLLISSGRKELSELFVAFGEGDTKGRIENILKDKNTVKWIAFGAVVLVVILGVVFLTKPADKAVVEETIVETTATVDIVKESETTEGITGLDKALLLEGAEEVELIPAAKISTNTISGTDGPIFDYLDMEWFERIVFHDYYGLFVYDMEPLGGIVGSIDLASIGCDKTQGDAMCEVQVTTDGELVYLKPANAKEGYIYDVEQNKLYRKAYNMGEIEGFDQFENTKNWLEADQTLRSQRCVKLGDIYHYLESGSGLPIDLVWRVEEYNDESGLSEIHQSQGVFADYSMLDDVSEQFVLLEQFTLLEQQHLEVLEHSQQLFLELKAADEGLDAGNELTKEKRAEIIAMIEAYATMASALEEQATLLAQEVTDDETLIHEIERLQTSIAALKKQAEHHKLLIERDTWLSREPQEVHELTMEELLELCNAGRVAFAETMSAQATNCIYSNFVREEQTGSLTWSYFCTLPYDGKEYRLQVSYWKPETAQEHARYANQLDSVYLVEKSSQDMQLLYYFGDRPYTENLDITAFIGKEYDIDDYLTLELPEGLTMGPYTIDFNDTWDGCVFQGDMEEPMHGDWCPDAWYAPGGVGVTTTDIEQAEFENGKLKSVSWYLNHAAIYSDFEYIDGCDMQAVLCEMAFDVFTIPEAEDYKAKHDLTDDDMEYQCHYWYVFFAEEDSDYVYSVCLNKQYYDREDVIALARSVKFVK